MFIITDVTKSGRFQSRKISRKSYTISEKKALLNKHPPPIRESVLTDVQGGVPVERVKLILPSHPFKSPIISPESRLESAFHTDRFGPNESRYNRRFENRDSSGLHGIRKKNRLNQFQTENDSQKGGTIPGKSRHKPPSLP